MRSQEHSSTSEADWLFCECTNCTHRWTENAHGYIGTIRCPIEDCGSKNVEISSSEDDDA